MNRLSLLVIPLLAVSCASTNGEIQPDPIYRETKIRHTRPRLAGEVFDSRESDPAYKEIFAAADKSAERAVAMSLGIQISSSTSGKRKSGF